MYALFLDEGYDGRHFLGVYARKGDASQAAMDWLRREGFLEISRTMPFVLMYCTENDDPFTGYANKYEKLNLHL